MKICICLETYNSITTKLPVLYAYYYMNRSKQQMSLAYSEPPGILNII